MLTAERYGVHKGSPFGINGTFISPMFDITVIDLINSVLFDIYSLNTAL